MRTGTDAFLGLYLWRSTNLKQEAQLRPLTFSRRVARASAPRTAAPWTLSARPALPAPRASPATPRTHNALGTATARAS